MTGYDSLGAHLVITYQTSKETGEVNTSETTVLQFKERKAAYNDGIYYIHGGSGFIQSYI